MSRKRRREQPDNTAAHAPASDSPYTEWNWATFPVFFAFSAGALVTSLLILIAPGAFYIFLVTALFLCLFGVAHYFGRSLRDYRGGDDDDAV